MLPQNAPLLAYCRSALRLAPVPLRDTKFLASYYRNPLRTLRHYYPHTHNKDGIVLQVCVDVEK